MKLLNSIKENNNLWEKISWTNIPQSVEHGCWWTVVPLFGGLHSAHASPQRDPLGLAHVQ